MDLLANGGIIALTLWIVGYLRVGWFAYRRILASRFFHYPWSGHAHAFAMISVAAVATYAFNPILLQPELAFLTWTTLGFLVGLAAIDPTAAGRQAASPPARGAVRVRQEGIQRQYASVASARIDHSGTRS
jgi:hypothetical protein